MRTTKRFTPKVLDRYIKLQRGEGSHESYVPWHRVTRGDPASSGRSHLLSWRSRLRELLSDGELGQQLFVTMLSDLDDCLEQFKLDTADSPHILAAYRERDASEMFPGTEQLARELGIKHPKVTDAGDSALWIPSTDFVLVFKGPLGPRHALALAFKPRGAETRRRTSELLSLDREYWVRRNVPWLLITPNLYQVEVVLTLRRLAAWALGADAGPEARCLASQLAHAHSGRTVTRVLQEIAIVIGSLEFAQRALWQAVWIGELPIDLRRGWRPHVPLKFISPAEFWAFNPIASRRSAWN